MFGIFERKINLFMQLQHENLVMLIDAFTSPADDLYIVMEAMVGSFVSYVLI
jgi:hypothetical protein